jgi:hypothetical protein
MQLLLVLRTHLDAQKNLLYCYAWLPALILQAQSNTQINMLA